MSHATVIHHFGSTAGMRRALVERMTERLILDIVAAMKRNVAPDVLIGDLFATFSEGGHGRLLAWRAIEDRANTPADRDERKPVRNATGSAGGPTGRVERGQRAAGCATGRDRRGRLWHRGATYCRTCWAWIRRSANAFRRGSQNRSDEATHISRRVVEACLTRTRGLRCRVRRASVTCAAESSAGMDVTSAGDPFDYTFEKSLEVKSPCPSMACRPLASIRRMLPCIALSLGFSMAVEAARPHWQSAVPGEVSWQHVTPSGTLIVNTTRSLIGIDTTTGRELWRHPTLAGVDARRRRTDCRFAAAAAVSRRSGSAHRRRQRNQRQHRLRLDGSESGADTRQAGVTQNGRTADCRFRTR